MPSKSNKNLLFEYALKSTDDCVTGVYEYREFDSFLTKSCRVYKKCRLIDSWEKSSCDVDMVMQIKHQFLQGRCCLTYTKADFKSQSEQTFVLSEWG